MMYLDLFMLTAIVVFIVDLSGFTDSWKPALAKYLHCKIERVRPFDCSLCMTFWSCLIYLLVTGNLTFINIAYISLLSYLTIPIALLMQVIQRLVMYILTTIMSKL